MTPRANRGGITGEFYNEGETGKKINKRISFDHTGDLGQEQARSSRTALLRDLVY